MSTDDPRAGLLGRLAVHHQLITEEQLAHATREQGRLGNTRRLGELLVAMRYLSPEQVNWLLEAQKQYLEKRRALEESVRASAAPAPAPAQAAAPGDRWLDGLLGYAVQQRASDVHVHAGGAIMIRLNGTLVAGSWPPLDRAGAERMVLGILTEEQRKELLAHNDLDFAYTLPGVGRFRASAYRQQRGIDAVFRAIPPRPPTLAEL